MSASPKKVGRHIVQVRLENFQDHKDTEIRLESGINLITGSSDAGKSAILRAINFVFHNLPRGKSFIRYGCDECRVTITFSDGTVVQRVKGEHNNSVLLKPAQGKGEKFDRIGNELPPKVMEALGNPPIDAKHGPLAYAEQMGPLFLVGLGGADLPRAISELTGIDNFQKAAEILGKSARQNATQIRDLAARIQRYDTQLEQYEGLDVEWDRMLAQERDLERIATESDLLTRARAFVTRHNEVVMEARGVKEALTHNQKLASLKSRLQSVLEVEQALQKARRLEASVSAQKKDIAQEDRAIAIADRLTNNEFKSRHAEAKALQMRLQTARDFSTGRARIIADARVIKGELDTWLETRQQKEAEQQSLIERMRQQGLWCNTCDRPVRKAENG